MTTDFRPEKVPTAEFPHPVGSFVLGSTGNVWEVVDRHGYAFVAASDGSSSGYYVQRDAGRILSEYEPLPDFKPERIPTGMFPFPVGSDVLGGLHQRYTVTDHDGFAYLAPQQGLGWYPRMESGRLLAELMPLAD